MCQSNGTIWTHNNHCNVFRTDEQVMWSYFPKQCRCFDSFSFARVEGKTQRPTQHPALLVKHLFHNTHCCAWLSIIPGQFSFKPGRSFASHLSQDPVPLPFSSPTLTMNSTASLHKVFLWWHTVGQMVPRFKLSGQFKSFLQRSCLRMLLLIAFI